MKILKLALLISFLFNSVAYPCEDASNTLRPPIMSGDKTNQKRLKFSLQNYNPKGTFAGWDETEKAIEQRFASTKERKEALQFVRTLAKKLAENKISPFYTLRDAIPSIAPLLTNPEDMQIICDMLFNLNMRLTENGLELYGVLVKAIPTVARVAKNIDELELFINLGIELAENKIDPIDTLYHAIPAVAKVAENMQELRGICNALFDLNMKFAENKIDPNIIFQYAIPAAAEVVKTTQEAIGLFDILFNLTIKFVENGKLNPLFENIVKQLFVAAGDSFYDLQEVCNDILPKMASKIKKVRVLDFIKAGHIKIGLKLQREYGDFKITYDYKYYPGNNVGNRIVRPSSETYQIQVLASPKAQLLKLLKLEPDKMSVDDIKICCQLSLAQRGNGINRKLQQALIEKLTELQEVRPETKQIIHDEGLRLLKLKYNGAPFEGLQNVRDQL